MFQSENLTEKVIAARYAVLYQTYFEEELIGLLNHNYYELRSQATLSLAKIHSKKSVGKITVLLQDEVEEVRYNAAKALGKLQMDCAASHLLDALDDYSKETRRQIQMSLAALDPSVVGREILTRLSALGNEDFNMETQTSISKIDVVRGIISICPFLPINNQEKIIEFGLNAPDNEMKRLACIAIGDLRTIQFVDQIIELSSHDDDDVRLAAVYALTKIDLEDKLDRYHSLANDSYEFIRELVAGEITTFPEDDLSIRILHELVSDPSHLVRVQVAKSLAYFQFNEELVDLLINDPYGDVRKAIAGTLGLYDSSIAEKKLEDMLVTEKDDLVAVSITNALHK